MLIIHSRQMSLHVAVNNVNLVHGGRMHGRRIAETDKVVPLQRDAIELVEELGFDDVRHLSVGLEVFVTLG